MKLVIASNNMHKVKEIKQILSPWFSDVVSMGGAGLALDVVEDGKRLRKTPSKKRGRFSTPWAERTPCWPTIPAFP